MRCVHRSFYEVNEIHSSDDERDIFGKQSLAPRRLLYSNFPPPIMRNFRLSAVPQKNPLTRLNFNNPRYSERVGYFEASPLLIFTASRKIFEQIC